MASGYAGLASGGLARGLLEEDDELSSAIWDRREREKGKEGRGRCDVAGRETEGGLAGTTVERPGAVRTIWGRDADEGGGGLS